MSRTQAERSGMTTSLLTAAARNLFGRDGYAATSIDAVAAAAGMTKGAAYHHFQGKVALFQAVFEAEQQRMAEELERVAAQEPDIWSAVHRGCRRILEECLDPAFRQIILLDAPAVLGWETVRAIEHRHTLRVLMGGVEGAAAEGRLLDGDLTVRAHVIFGAVCEGGMLLARSDDPSAALPAVTAEMDRLLDGFSQL
jgi:AcrR family transcriptional regulator